MAKGTSMQGQACHRDETSMQQVCLLEMAGKIFESFIRALPMQWRKGDERGSMANQQGSL